MFRDYFNSVWLKKAIPFSNAEIKENEFPDEVYEIINGRPEELDESEVQKLEQPVKDKPIATEKI